MKILALFAGYDKDNIIDDYVVFYIEKLKKVADIIYVSDCNMNENELNKISDYCIHIINGRHEEYDFGSYKRGYIYAEQNNLLQNYDYLILCNDSVYGPLFNLNNIINKMENAQSDIWGIFKYLEDKNYKEHLQSYFISIKKEVFIQNYFKEFIYSIKKENDKRLIINKYEIGFGILLKEHNLIIKYFLDSSIKANTNDDNNVVVDNPLLAISNGFPFLKIAFFKEIPLKRIYLKDLINLVSFIKDKYNVKMIINHLNRTMSDNKSLTLRRFKVFNCSIIHKKLFNVSSMYSLYQKYQLILIFFNKIKITINVPEFISFTSYKNFNFLLKYIEK
ncbi:rhamnan synthesis F family protein [Brachyspira hyodysenteriae]|uniref:Glycosyl transferase, group 1-like protein n=2 Tax=Brachyspira hyodysenteriae TaxID=159 RepID=A0A3B6VCC7_BRAHW|nr:rhamnan synthesis F family protein [Brachyspira hyodysenteriae]ACN85120.1 glycosyl transferase, group 1-like protein [Brachyspira hyodysenteriae WA1]KLI19529.1 glycosyl transferase family 1 [Brachyspira hyodysenteriae]KLI27807.1 glycosyl transferase family 1 [Brachyspira hyodysenteriae]KLI42961.1 glycosyl transferase family 1 [Brachyspira hyodysenteriae]KLI49017.1 glycosyl transferase family 1 [Brachyspira hyodysenteriae]